MRRLAVIVSLAAALLVALAIVRATVRDAPEERLSGPEFLAMAQQVGFIGAPGAPCVPLTSDADQRLRDIHEDCVVSQRMAVLRRLLSTCQDTRCARETSAELVGVALRAEVIERGFAARLRGDCRTFFLVEADYDHGIAEAADPLRALPGDAFLSDRIGAWNRESIATADAIDREPVADLLMACHPSA